MKKILALLLVVCMFLMSGCMMVEQSVTIQPDGSGQVIVTAGYSEDGLREMLAMMGQGMTEEDLDAAFNETVASMKKIEKNGVTYYVATSEGTEGEVKEFSSIRELNGQLPKGESEEILGVEVETVKVVRNEDGSLALSIYVPVGLEVITGRAIEMNESVAGAELGKAMVSNMIIGYSYNFPKAVKQVSGPGAGVTIDGNILFIDFVAMMKEVDKSGPQTWEFVTEPDAVAPTKLLFSDVTEDKWYYDAVVTIAKDGIVNGMGDGTFAPENTMTYAQFCQLLAKTMGAEVGEENGYWAGKAIAVCTEQSDLVISRGAITPENYDVPITREAAISAMFLLTGGNAEELGVVIGIPDEADISEEYKNNIFAAYVVGITSGVDENGTFMPKKELTRAEVCQLFYNMWN